MRQGFFERLLKGACARKHEPVRLHGRPLALRLRCRRQDMGARLRTRAVLHANILLAGGAARVMADS